MRQLLESLYLVEKEELLNADRVKRFRKDFLTLMKNVKPLLKSNDVEKVDLWRSAVIRWGKEFDELMSQVKKEIETRIQDAKYRDRNINIHDAESLLKEMSPVWSFSSDMRSPPGNPLAYYHTLRRDGGPYWTDARIFSDFSDDAGKWERRVRGHSRKAWKWLDMTAKWTLQTGLNSGGGEPVTLSTSGDENLVLSGFKVQLKNYKGTDFNEKNIVRLKKGLEIYRKRAGRVFPEMLRSTLPIVMYFGDQQGSASASFENDHIKFNQWGSSHKPKEVAKIMAHEMAHLLWRSKLSGEARDAWRKFVRGTSEEIDLRKVYRDWGDKDERTLIRENPVLWLQLETLMYDPAYRYFDLFSFRRIRDYLDGGGDPMIRVTTKPVTGYGAKNSEEAFCEALGLLVAYGPRTVLPEVRRMVGAFFPRLKMEDVEGGCKMKRLIEMAMYESVGVVDKTDNPNVIEYAVRFLFKGKSPSSAAKATVKKLSGYENLFLGPGIAHIDEKGLEELIWGRLVNEAIRGMGHMKAGMEHFAIDATLQQFSNKPMKLPGKAIRKKFKKMIVKKLGHDPFVNDKE